MKKLIIWLLRSLIIVFTLFFLPLGCMVAAHYTGGNDTEWWQLSNESSSQAPDARKTNDAIIQVYAARAARWRGAFGVHTWIAAKRTNENYYTRFEVIGYAVYWGHDAVRVRRGSPDKYWYGNRPTLLRELRGDQGVDKLIDKLYATARAYPYNNTYHVWPGPNSNTFTAYLARQLPELRLELPSTAIGKDYLANGAVFAQTPSGSGAQLSLNGYVGILAGVEEGLEFNILGLSAGIDLMPPAIKLPGIGRLGFSDKKSYQHFTVAAPIKPFTRLDSG